MSSIAQDVAFQTLDALEQRLQRVRFLLYGSAAAAAADNDDQTPTDTTITQTQSIASRLQALQSSFNSVLSDSKSAQAIVALQSQHQHDGPDMTSDALAALVLSHAPSYQATAARLTSLQDTPVPNSSALAALVELHPRLERVATRQDDQQLSIAQLRHQSLALLGRWYHLGIIGMDDCWTEWEARLMDQEKLVRRAEAEKRLIDNPN
ncbi:hypothetical protein D6D23_07330 [Aureobasidium pullulans]|uniref:Nuclear distribution protein RO10 n=2 Tax=Aureobasidium pullulans TaxID=5580 RepID=A0A4S8W466_AURPU|nr:hypothetical protein D6D23_07330 [Aureobasidium pullulans]THW38841.1 hypothetical protein D6D22_06581 [Aureobasidium pullulans]THX04522.1 hypothetical protein D6D18_03287 [Aureobasidium pullulans]THZ68756.1 hypothetical protein D6C85_07269 [Aureobasidium pullulans]TIA02686.1 hypothetical protein D6C82_02543 [Aureobasidium pullulans]